MTVNRNRALHHLAIRAALVIAVGCALSRPAVADDVPAPSRVRSSDASIAALMDRGVVKSKTFRALRGAIDVSDGIVYVEPGRCGHGVRACLANSVQVSGPNRLMQVRVETRHSDLELIASIGHELQHVLEVLGERSITTAAAMFNFWQSKSVLRDDTRFETNAAINAGDAIRRELGLPW